jgi:sortase A
LFGQFMAPSRFAAGWHPTSARLGEIGNTVINGHHNMLGRVFQNLVNVSVGDEIIMYSRDREYRYIVTQKMILMERDAPVTVRANNARWMMRSTDERLTLITCWPAYSNTHRLVIVAAPIDIAP